MEQHVINEDYTLYFNSKEYYRIERNDIVYVLDKRITLNMFSSHKFMKIMSYELWQYAILIYNVIDCISFIEKNRYGKSGIYMYTKNIKFGKIICKLTRR